MIADSRGLISGTLLAGVSMLSTAVHVRDVMFREELYCLVMSHSVTQTSARDALLSLQNTEYSLQTGQLQ